ncbi:MAG: hypothetical protein KME35_11515 [Aphanocapsa sp. GSE-SYN-MK-11-07L]|nr:hypothetical protein [Aphanocapsa sp. GSE-SYN-MK-11-07L]
MEEDRFWSSDGIWVLKLILLSVLISIGIKTLGPDLALPPTIAVILALVFLPTVVLTVALLWRYAVKD